MEEGLAQEESAQTYKKRRNFLIVYVEYSKTTVSSVDSLTVNLHFKHLHSFNNILYTVKHVI